MSNKTLLAAGYDAAVLLATTIHTYTVRLAGYVHHPPLVPACGRKHCASKSAVRKAPFTDAG